MLGRARSRPCFRGGFVDVTRKTPALRFALVAALVAVALTVAPTASAAKRKPARGGTSSSISLVLLNDATEAHFGAQVTFRVSTTATTGPWVNLRCYQNGALVYSQWHGFYPSYIWGQVFTLGPTPSWQSGAADCNARLIKLRGTRETTLATTSFHAYE
jgi:hypothetical protein